ncbi:MAG: hypothetical protein M3Z08_19850 [Chloroflexota bacterium]|nr:hypothetical protein [Chloroflexota bacterium]
MNSCTRDDIGQINRVETGGGWGNLSYGKARHIQRGNRLFTVAETLQGIPNVRMVEDLLSTTFKSVPR